MAKVMLPVLLLLSAFLLVSTIPGGISPVQDVKNNKEVQDLGRFCVEEFNRQLLQHSNGGGERLVFSEVVDALEQVVAGVKYYLKIAAWSMENREMAIYDAQVNERRNLLETPKTLKEVLHTQSNENAKIENGESSDEVSKDVDWKLIRAV
ncbi:cysteine proteinase inhibitor B [Manihot esculenta]|uniref:cysteine proteinase inhibitor B n=1 Tax=Manihot esculenta TaxID=3983 RepID=UPI000B5D4960|nr:cysteine proteinase inhibitor B [Manihot esculenta]